jgi:amino acid permease
METALLVVFFLALFVVFFVVLLPALNSDALRKQRATRDRALARYKHHPDANLLSLND